MTIKELHEEEIKETRRNVICPICGERMVMGRLEFYNQEFYVWLCMSCNDKINNKKEQKNEITQN